MRLRFLICANGETIEFWLEQDGRDVSPRIWLVSTEAERANISSMYPRAFAAILRRTVDPYNAILR